MNWSKTEFVEQFREGTTCPAINTLSRYWPKKSGAKPLKEEMHVLTFASDGSVCFVGQSGLYS